MDYHFQIYHLFFILDQRTSKEGNAKNSNRTARSRHSSGQPWYTAKANYGCTFTNKIFQVCWHLNDLVNLNILHYFDIWHSKVTVWYNFWLLVTQPSKRYNILTEFTPKILKRRLNFSGQLWPMSSPLFHRYVSFVCRTFE